MKAMIIDRRRSAAGAAALAMLFATGALAQSGPPAPYDVTPELIDAAKKEGTITFYTATDVAVAEKVAAAFEAKYPGIKVKVERSGSERVFQRLSQEYGSSIYNADVVETSDAVHFLLFKRNGWLAQAVPAEVAKDWPKDAKDPDGYFAAYRAHLSVIGYNSRQVKPEEAPKSHADLLNPKWRGRIVKAHPGYSGTVMTGTDALSHALGWDYLREARQAAHHAGAVFDRAAEEARARRALNPGRRQRIQHVHAEGDRRTCRNRVRRRKARRSPSVMRRC